MKMATVVGGVALVLSACGLTGEQEMTRTNMAVDPVKISDETDDVQTTQNDGTEGFAGGNPAEGVVACGYEGEYSSYDVDEPALEIKENSDGTYAILISLYRLCLLDDGVGKETENGLEFTATGPWEGGVNGVVTLEEDIATVTFFGQEWLDFAGLSEYRFYKTSDVPDMRDYSDDADTETATAEELLDLFINGSINAVDPADVTSAFYITDLNMGSEEWDSYSVGEKVDLDNDGENELIICGPYGGIYLDARDGKVYKFAGGDGTALILSYTYYNGDVWILYSNRSSAGFEFFHMEKFEGADNLVAEMNFGEEFDVNNAEAGLKYTLNGDEISYDEYAEFCSKIFAAEVSTNLFARR